MSGKVPEEGVEAQNYEVKRINRVILGEIGDVPEKKMEIVFLKNQLTNSIIVSFH